MITKKTKPLGELAENITVGFVGSMASEYVDQGVPFLRSLNVRPFFFDESDLKYITEEFHDKIRKSTLNPGDVVVVRTGTPGASCVIPDSLAEANCSDLVIIRCGKNLDPHFVSYFINSVTHSQVKGQLVGAIQKHFNIGSAKELVFPDIDRFSQSKIAAVLSALDAKIECNNRINAELEAMAKTLYDYWFVQFDFPFDFASGKPAQNGKPYKSSGGKMVYNPTLKREIPAGWKDSTIGETFKTHLGGTPSREKKKYWIPGEVNWLSSGENPSTFVVEPNEKISQLGLHNSAAKLLPQGTVILSIVRHIRASILGIEAATNQSVVGVLETDKIKHCYIYPYLVREIPRLMTLRTGAQQPHINKSVLDVSLLVLPDEATLEVYTNLAAPLFLQIKNYHQQNQHLTQLRDWLLPMLMNGQITVV